MDPQPIDFDTLYGNLSSEAHDLLQSTLKDSLKGFLVSIKNAASSTGSEDPFNRMVAEFACCPPPRAVSLSAFDDLVIKLLGDCGGSDELLWHFSSHLPNRTLAQTTAMPFASSSSGAVEETVSAENCEKGENGEMVIDAQSQSSSVPVDEPSVVCNEAKNNNVNNANNTIGTLPNHTTEEECRSEALPSLALRYWSSLVAAANSTTETSLSCTEAPDCAARALELLLSAMQQPHQAAIDEATSDLDVALGKRGRYFLDIWEEEEFLQRNKTKTKFRTLRQWEDLFHAGYCDNHDGCYRDWLLSKQQDTKARLLDPKYTKKPRKSDPIFRSAVMEVMDTRALGRIIPPPVPVAIHHPAAWGIRSPSDNGKNKLPGASARNGRSIDVHVVHPASIRTAPIYPQHQRQLASSTTHTKNGSTGTPHQAAANYHEFRGGKRKAAWAESVDLVSILQSGIEDVDDFNLYASKTQKQLHEEEARNYIRIARLQQIMKINSSALALSQKRDRLEGIVYKAVQRMEPTSADRVMYAFKPGKPAHSPRLSRAVSASMPGQVAAGSEREGVLRLDVQGRAIQRCLSADNVPATGNGQSRYNTRCINTDSIVSVLRPNDVGANYRREMLGASATRHVLHGGLLVHCLQVDAEVEVCLNRRWQFATITRIVYDGDLARHIKVIPEDCTPLESVWIAVEDGRIAPHGTHLRLVKAAATVVPAPAPLVAPVQAALTAQSAASVAPSSSSLPSQLPVRVASSASSDDLRKANKYKHALEDRSGVKMHTVTPEDASPQRPASRATDALEYAGNNRQANSAASAFTKPVPVQINHTYNNNKTETGTGTGTFAEPGIKITKPSDVRPERTGPLLDPRVQKKLLSMVMATPKPANPVVCPDENDADEPEPEHIPVRPAASFATPSEAIAAGLCPAPPRPPARPAAATTERVKLSLPLGASSADQLIPAVPAYTQITYPSVHPQYAHLYQSQMPYQNLMPYAGHSSMYGSSYFHPAVQGGVPYEYEREPEPSRPTQPVYDSVGYHNLNARGQPQQVSAQRAAPLMPPRAFSAATAYSSSGSSSSGNSSSAAPGSTFRLGPKGSVSKN